MSARKREEESRTNREYQELKKRHNLRGLSIIIERIAPRKLEILRKQAEIRKLLHSVKDAPQVNDSVKKSRKRLKASSAEEELKCTVEGCGYKNKFPTEEELQGHLKRCHEGIKKPFECPTCQKSFQTLRLLWDHENSHNKEKPYLCSDCGSTFSSKDGFDRHQTKHHPDSLNRRLCIFTCKDCRDKFVSRKLWEIHCITHLPLEEQAEAREKLNHKAKKGKIKSQKPKDKRKLSCKYCGYKVAYSSKLQEHLLVHTNERTKVCPICDKSFKKNSALTSHMATHSEDRPFSCRYCSKSFKLNKHLLRHVRLHGEKTHQCQSCYKTYATDSLLKQHIASHRNCGTEIFSGDSSDSGGVPQTSSSSTGCRSIHQNTFTVNSLFSL